MKLMLDVEIKSPGQKIQYGDKVMLIGSCFTEHIGNRLHELKFDVLQNPNGILFDPLSVVSSLISYIQNKNYSAGDLIYLNELWQSWQHHSRYSDPDQQLVLSSINNSQFVAHQFLQSANWLIITLGTSFSYRLVENNSPVANCHRAPAQMFRKHLMTIEEINSALDNCLYQLFRFNRELRIVFTVSPVRHIRDGIIDNNRSKARLIESVHHLVNKFDRLYYFPAYELVNDVLRDYRYFDIDLVHPNYQATEFVFEKFVENFIGEEERLLIEEIKQIVVARKHRAFHSSTMAHQLFLKASLKKVMQIQKKNPRIDLTEEIEYFSALCSV